MKVDNSLLGATAALAFASLSSGTLLIPVARPLLQWAAPGSASASHAFMALSLAGGFSVGGVSALSAAARLAR